MRIKCPVCNSTNIHRLHTARRIGSTVGAVGGAATGAGGALSGAQTGAAVGAVGGAALAGGGVVVAGDDLHHGRQSGAHV